VTAGKESSMRSTEYDEFAAMLDAAAGMLQRSTQEPLTAEARTMFFRAMAQFTLPAVRMAFDAHVRDPERGRFFPTPADLIAQLERARRDDSRPGADEAWALALRARDEAATVVWSTEIRDAWAVAKEVFDVGDEVGARLAFRQAYERAVHDA